MPVALRPPWVKISQRGLLACPRDLLRVDGDDDALVAEFFRRLAHEIRVLHRGGVDRDLVGAGKQQLADVLDGPHAAADGERHEAGLRRAPHHVEQDPPRLVAGGDVEEAELIGAGRVVSLRRFHGIARIDEIDELHALHDAPVLDVEAGDETDFEHQADSLRTDFSSASASCGSMRPS